MLIQSAWAAIRTNAGTIFNNFYTQIAIRRGKGKAIVATARKMVEIFYVMMKNGELYKGIESVDIEKKLKSYGIIKKNDKRS